MIEITDALYDAVLREALIGLNCPRGEQKTLSPWLFYDERGSQLFEQITTLPEYYLTRTERAIFAAHAEEIFAAMDGCVTVAELGAGTAAKTGLLLDAATRLQGDVLYQPIDVSPTALDEAAAHLAAEIPGVRVKPQVANYVTETFTLARPESCKVLSLYIGSSIGNFSPEEASAVLSNLRDHLEPGDALLLGTDLAPGKNKSVASLVAAYDDAQGVTAAFNKNVLVRLNRELDADFSVECFAHRAVWNAAESRMEMHLVSVREQVVHVGGERIAFAAGETIHTENSYKFSDRAIDALLGSADFERQVAWRDGDGRFAVTLAFAV
jgi:L-histidine N-alpha-methyltransferase